MRDPPGWLRKPLAAAEAEAEKLTQSMAGQGFVLTPADPEWPQALEMLPAAPLALFGLGARAVLQRMPRIGVTGSRRALAETQHVLRAWGRYWARAGACVCAGLEGAADCAALEGAWETQGACLGIAASGLKALSASAARTARSLLAAGGAVVSELAPHVHASKAAYARRAQLLAAFADALVVAEASAHSHALGVARAALELGREVAAMPGPVWSERFRGAHALIRTGALLVDAPEQILAALGVQAEPEAQALSDLADEEAQVLQALQEGPQHLDMLAARLGLTMDRLLPILLALEMKGVVVRLAGGRYAKR